MRSHEIDDSDLLYENWPLPQSELAAYWLRSAYELIEGGIRVPVEYQKILTELGVDALEFIRWAELNSDHTEYMKAN